MTDKPRTWTIAEAADGYVPFEPRLKDEGECSFMNERLTEVIELEPVLDLLEEALGPKRDNEHVIDVNNRLHALLGEHRPR